MHRENDKIERYKTYLRLEKALSANSIDAYLTDLDKLTNFVESEGKKYADVTYDDLQQFVARLHDIGIHHVHRQGSFRDQIFLPVPVPGRLYNN